MNNIHEVLAILEDCGNSLRRSQSNLKKCPTSRLTIGYLKTRLNLVEEYWETFKSYHEELLRCVPEEKRFQIDYFTNDDFYIYEDIYFCLKTDLQHLMKSPAEPSILKFEDTIIEDPIANISRIHTTQIGKELHNERREYVTENPMKSTAYSNVEKLPRLTDIESQKTLVSKRGTSIQTKRCKKSSKGARTNVNSTTTDFNHAVEIQLLPTLEQRCRYKVKVTRRLNKQLSLRRFSLHTWSQSQDLVLAYPRKFMQSERVFMLSGAVCTQTTYDEDKSPLGFTRVQDSSLGWILFGLIQQETRGGHTTHDHANRRLKFNSTSKQVKLNRRVQVAKDEYITLMIHNRRCKRRKKKRRYGNLKRKMTIDRKEILNNSKKKTRKLVNSPQCCPSRWAADTRYTKRGRTRQNKKHKHKMKCKFDKKWSDINSYNITLMKTVTIAMLADASTPSAMSYV